MHHGRLRDRAGVVVLEAAGDPVALLGLGAYAAIFATSLGRTDVARAAGAAIALAGVGFAAYLLYVQLSVIDAVCEWCLVSDALMLTIAALAAARLRAAQ